MARLTEKVNLRLSEMKPGSIAGLSSAAISALEMCDEFEGIQPRVRVLPLNEMNGIRTVQLRATEER